MEIFIEETEANIESIVQEFYASVYDAIDNQETVWGIQVPFGPSDINSYYGLMDVGQGEYENYLSNVDCSEVIENLV